MEEGRLFGMSICRRIRPDVHAVHDFSDLEELTVSESEGKKEGGATFDFRFQPSQKSRRFRFEETFAYFEFQIYVPREDEPSGISLRPQDSDSEVEPDLK